MPSYGQGLGWTDGNAIQLTPIGGIAVRLINKTAGNSVKGTLVRASSSTAGAFETIGTSEADPIGVVYESGIADASLCWVVVAGVAECLVQDSVAATVRGWCSVSATQAGRINIGAAPPTTPGSWADVQLHMLEVGHCIQAVSAGTNVLAKVVIHFN